jgi:hypothetical protein
MCSDGYKPDEETVGECEDCGGPVDKDGDSTDYQCLHSPKGCDKCNDHPCDQSC